MTTFNGTAGNDSIRRTSVSAGVEMLPDPVAGTLTGELNLIYGNDGDDVLEAGDGTGDIDANGDQVYGGAGNDTIYGGTGFDSLFGEDGDDVIYGSANFGVGFDSYDGGAGNDIIHAASSSTNFINGGTGADTMYGGAFNDVFSVDDADDKVIENLDGGQDVVNSFLARIRLAENVEALSFVGGDQVTDQHATGNKLDNSIFTREGNDTVFGGAGNDFLNTAGGSDKVYGGGGNDTIEAGHGADRVYGGAGNDWLRGGFDADCLVGGKGGDLFIFDSFTDSTPTRRDTIAGADGVAAFEGAGRAKGDQFDLRSIDADLTTPEFEAFIFGGKGKGHLSLANSGSDTLLRGNLDDDGGFEFQCLIQDGDMKATAYAAADFLLTWN